MPQVAGVTTKKNIKGDVTHVTINVKKHKEMIPLFKEMGIIQKTSFQKECEDAISIEEFRVRVHSKLKDLWHKK
jgi:hypothetical protein